MNLLFLVEDARSGSTFLSNLLKKTYDIFIPWESNLLKNCILFSNENGLLIKESKENFIKAICLDPKQKEWLINTDLIRDIIKGNNNIDEIFKKIVRQEQKLNNSKNNSVLIKKGSNIHYLNDYFKIDHNAKAIILIRDPRAVINSKLKSKKTDGNHFVRSMLHVIYEYNLKYFKILKLKLKFSKRSLLISYKDLIIKPEVVSDSIKKFGKLNTLENTSDEKFTVPYRYQHLHKNVHTEALSSRITAWKKEMNFNRILITSVFCYPIYFILKVITYFEKVF